jgi:hypothetical protein
MASGNWKCKYGCPRSGPKRYLIAIVLLSLVGGNSGPAVCGAYNTFANGFNVNCAGSGSTNAVLKVTVFNPLSSRPLTGIALDSNHSPSHLS